MNQKVKRPVVLICIDGWGINQSDYGNAILAADTPVMDEFYSKRRNFAELDASGLAVGLPEGVMGNSEVGHLTIGSGRPQYQDLVRIDLAVKEGSLAKNETLLEAIDRAKTVSNGRMHLLGLVSDGGVHSHERHLHKLLEILKDANVPEVYVHAFTDGRDTDPHSGKGFIEKLLKHMRQLGEHMQLATCTGRYYAMDRDKRWDRIDLALRGLVNGDGEETADVLDTIQKRYDGGETDEFLKPIIVCKKGCITSKDTLLFFDFRSDRMREIVQTLGQPAPYETKVQVPKDLGIFCMSQYDIRFPFPVLFPPVEMKNVLAEWIGNHDLFQFHTAETEKYAHVTFFFNGGVEKAYKGEDRKLIPSPKVPTYDLEPKMSMYQVGEALIEAMKSGKYAFIMCNLAAPDMVGHTGVYEATVEACTHCDKVIGQIWKSCQELGYVLCVTADHGNAECMLTEDGRPITSHTTNFVPFILADPDGKLHFKEESSKGTLADVAPTILSVMGLPIPKEMKGRVL
ncbi:phosphoglycerate mutase [Cyanidioschyzon merolae strain 10D]|uniref:phosphoglycerate mutase (2,3-diphosphoglycerate-independent) n=1 Tax=Cyanidioschyzon merolae (strain NIES-3377 / 10D) TaxID=280699 RepID=M1V5F0_CYAM1|nr:phosphoglycerate mutase [Cyanidioschyzon merolae strain 10D]BAM80555.1 phosphoglycerate mutase [Cyanidioschyzon merolae strain 10D]|eukprot:XP_005536591.1 phosphoglycerate mutase [Cyanidioschyzon merolae strain 10D]